MSALENLRHSVVLAKAARPHLGTSGRPGPFVCATVELRVADLEWAVARVEALEAALREISESGACSCRDNFHDEGDKHCAMTIARRALDGGEP